MLLLFSLAIAGASLAGTWWTGTVHSLKLVAVVVVADGLWKMARSLTQDAARVGIAVVSAGIVVWLGTADAQMIALAFGAAAGLLLSRVTDADQTAALEDQGPDTNQSRSTVTKASTKGSVATLLLFVALLAAALSIRDTGPSLVTLGASFVRAGSLVFGGGHVVLPLLEESVVSSGWLNSDAFLTGYGAAQAVPGPMFSFAAYLGALTPWSGASPSVASSAIGALVAVLAIFTPGFLLVAAALPLWTRISANVTARGVILGVNAAVVGIRGTSPRATTAGTPTARAGCGGHAEPAPAPPTIVPAPRLAPAEASRRWAALLRQIFEVDPLACPACHGTMRIVAHHPGVGDRPDPHAPPRTRVHGRANGAAVTPRPVRRCSRGRRSGGMLDRPRLKFLPPSERGS